jgi:epoxyqueuosine reductase QueG
MNLGNDLPHRKTETKKRQDPELQKLKTQIWKIVKSCHGNLFGIADLKEINEGVTLYYGGRFDRYTRAISVAVFFPRDLVNELASGPKYAYRYCYDVINRKLDDISLNISLFLQVRGFHAFPVPSSEYEVEQTALTFHHLVDDKAEPLISIPRFEPILKGAFSHRMAAQRAGLGWIGKSCCLINPLVGPQLRLVTVLTDAPLQPDKPIDNRCGTCTACRDACPTKAIRGVTWRQEDPREVRLNANDCCNYLNNMREVFGRAACGLCLVACPWGKRADSSAVKITNK